jgi:hypothetical protein
MSNSVESQLLNQLVLRSIIARLPFRDRVTLKLFVAGWEVSELNLTQSRLNGIIKQVMVGADLKVRCSDCRRYRHAKYFYQTGSPMKVLQSRCSDCIVARPKAAKKTVADKHYCAGCHKPFTRKVKGPALKRVFCSSECFYRHRRAQTY